MEDEVAIMRVKRVFTLVNDGIITSTPDIQMFARSYISASPHNRSLMDGAASNIIRDKKWEVYLSR